MRRLAAALLVVSAALLLVGRAAADEPAAESTEAVEGFDEGEEAAGAEEDAESSGAGEPEEREEAEKGEETLLGVDVESPLAIAGAMVLSLLLAAGLLSNRARPFAIATIGVGVGFAVFDVAELARKLDESQTGTAVFAGLVAAGHLAAAGAAGLSLRADAPDTA